MDRHIDTINNSEAANYVTRMELFRNATNNVLNLGTKGTLYSEMFEPGEAPFYVQHSHIRMSIADAEIPKRHYEPALGDRVYRSLSAPKTHRYVVFSYRDDWPLYIAEWDAGADQSTAQWYENIDRFSNATSKHRTQARPYHSIKTLPMTLKQMLLIAEFGIAGMIVYGGGNDE